MNAFRRMADDAKDLVTCLVGGIGENDLPPMVHLLHREGFVTGWASDAEIAPRAVALAGEHAPEVLALTFHGARGRLDGFFEHEVATVVVIDRERIEVWEARLVRHDGTASLGAWRPWPIDAAAGKLTTPIQNAMRGTP